MVKVAITNIAMAAYVPARFVRTNWFSSKAVNNASAELDAMEEATAGAAAEAPAAEAAAEASEGE